MASSFCSGEDPFAVLGIDESATDKKVQSAFRHLALRCHPDRHPKDPLAKTRFLRLSRAKEALLDPARRSTAEAQRRSRCQGQPAQKQTPGPGGVNYRSAAEKKQQPRDGGKERRRKAEAAALLRKKEAEAKEAKRQRAEETAKAKRKSDSLFAQKQEEMWKRAAASEQKKADLFEAFMRKKNAQAATQEPAHPPVLHALVTRFASSKEATLFVRGPPLGDAERSELWKAATEHGLSIVEEDGGFHLNRASRAYEDRDDSPWEPAGGTRADNKSKRIRKRASKASASDGASERHRKAIERLQIRRQNGEGPAPPTPQGSWFVRDEKAESYAKDIDRFGF